MHCDSLDENDVSKDVAAFAQHLGELGSKFILDPTASQFKTPPDYRKGRGRGFLTKKPSKRARELMIRMVWQ